MKYLHTKLLDFTNNLVCEIVHFSGFGGTSVFVLYVKL